MKKYAFSYAKLERVKNNEYKETQNAKFMVEKIKQWDEGYFDLCFYGYDFSINGMDSKRKEYEEKILDLLFLRIDKNLNLFEVLNKDKIKEKLDIIKEMSEDIDYINMNFQNILKLNNLLLDDELLNIAVSNYNFYEIFFSEIYNRFQENFRGKLEGNKYIMGVLKNELVPLELELVKLGDKNYKITGSLNNSEIPNHKFIEKINDNFRAGISKITINYESNIELDNNNVIKSIKSIFTLQGDNNFFIGKNSIIEEIDS